MVLGLTADLKLTTGDGAPASRAWGVGRGRGRGRQTSVLAWPLAIVALGRPILPSVSDSCYSSSQAGCAVRGMFGESGSPGFSLGTIKVSFTTLGK